MWCVRLRPMCGQSLRSCVQWTRGTIASRATSMTTETQSTSTTETETTSWTGATKNESVRDGTGDWTCHLLSRYDTRVRSIPNPHVVTPNLDFSTRFEDLCRLQEVLEARDHRLDCSVTELKERHDRWCHVLSQFHEAERTADGNQELSEEERKQWRMTCGDLKKQLNELLPIAVQCLHLPNELLPETPLLDLHPQPIMSTRHMHILRSLDMVSVSTEPNALYLIGKPVQMQMAVADMAESAVCEDCVSTRVSPSYMIRPAIIEACSLDPADFIDFVDKDGQAPMRLVGVSLPAFAAVLCKNKASHVNTFPIHMHAAGTAYRLQRLVTEETEMSLFSCPQSQLVASVQLSRDMAEASDAYGRLCLSVQNLLEQQLCLPVRAVTVSSNGLLPAEMTAVSVEAFGAQLARISFLGTYVSERVQTAFSCPSDPMASAGYLHLNYCQIDCTAVVAAIIEHFWSPGDCSKMPEIWK